MTEEDNDTAVIGISLPEYKERNVGGKPVTMYVVEIINRINKKTWSLEKRYSEFKSFRDGLVKLIPNLPTIPGTTLFKVTSPEALNKRKTLLEIFLRECVQRKDIMNIDSFREFLNIDKEAPELIGNKVTLKFEYLKVPLGVRDFKTVLKKDIMLMVCSDMSLASRTDSILTNFSFPWEKKNESHVPLGAAFVYQCELKKDGGYEVHRIWAKSYAYQTGILYWEDETETFCIGLDNGQIIAVKHDGSSHYQNMNQILDVHIHKDRVMGLALDPGTSLLYSCSSDKTFYGTDIKANPPISSIIKITEGGYTNMYYDKPNDRIFLTDTAGGLAIYKTSRFPPENLIDIQTNSYSSIRALHIDFNNNYIFTGDVEGKIRTFSLGTPGKEKFISELNAFGATMKFRICRYNPVNHELIAGDQDGRVTIWSLKTKRTVHVWEAHHKAAITQMEYNPRSRLLWTGAKDKSFKVWQLPERWQSAEVEDFEKTEKKNIADNIAFLKIQKVYKRLDENDSDSSADDLNGWDYRDY